MASLGRLRVPSIMTVLLLAGLGLVGAGAVLSFREESGLDAMATPQPVVQLEAAEARIVIRHKGDPQVELRAEEVRVDTDLQRATFDRVRRATVYREGRETLYIAARRIVFNRQTSNFVATGEVLVTSPDGDWLRSEYMIYLNDRAVLAFPKGVEFQIGTTRARATRLRYHVLTETVEMEQGADVTLDLRSLPTPGGTP